MQTNEAESSQVQKELSTRAEEGGGGRRRQEAALQCLSSGPQAAGTRYCSVSGSIKYTWKGLKYFSFIVADSSALVQSLQLLLKLTPQAALLTFTVDASVFNRSVASASPTQTLASFLFVVFDARLTFSAVLATQLCLHTLIHNTENLLI